MEKLTCNSSLQWSKIQSNICQYVKHIKQKNNTAGLHSLVRLYAEQVDECFLKNCIKICVSRQLSAIINKTSDVDQAEVIESVRQYYFQMFTSGPWKEQFKFQIGVVCITKLVSEFFNCIFVDVKINEKLQAEIYVILIYVVMGIRVGPKSFQVLQKKYLKERKKPRRTVLKVKQSSQRVRQSFSNPIYNQIFQRKSIIQNRFNLLEIQKSSIEDFLQFMKENLYVAPLPQLVKQKKSIEHYSKKQSTQDLANFEYLPSSPTKNEEIDEKHRRFPLLSTQLSVSMHSQIIQRNVSIASHCKPLKIKQRNPYLSNHSLVFRSNNGKDLESLDQYSKSKDKQQQKWRMSSKEWNQAISQIKNHFSNNQQKRIQKLQKAKRFHRQAQADPKFERNDSLNESYHRLKATTLGNYQKFEISSTSTPMKTTNDNLKDSKNIRESYLQYHKGSLKSGVKQHREVTEPESNNYIMDMKKSSKIDRRTLKQSQKSFLKQSQFRNERIDYSMFMLPKKGITGKHQISKRQANIRA